MDDENEVKIPNPRDAIIEQAAKDARKLRDDALAAEGLLNTEIMEPIPSIEEELGESANVNLGDGGREVPPPPTEDVDITAGLADTPIIQRDGEFFISTVVNGETVEVPMADAVTKLQKDGNLDHATKLANDARNNFDAATKALGEAPQTPSTQPDDKTASVYTREDIESAVDAFYEKGEKGSLVDMLSKLATPAPAQQLTTEQVSDLVKNGVAEHDDNIALTSAYDHFTQDERFASIVADQNLLDIVDTETDKLQNDADYMAGKPSYEEIFIKAGENTLAWVDSKIPNAEPSEQLSEAEQNEERKASMSTPVASMTSRRGVPPEPKPKTNDQVISDMRKHRGQSL